MHRFDFGASPWPRKCTTCGARVFNRGCGECEARLCKPCFASHSCPHGRSSLDSTSNQDISATAMGNSTKPQVPDVPRCKGCASDSDWAREARDWFNSGNFKAIAPPPCVGKAEAGDPEHLKKGANPGIILTFLLHIGAALRCQGPDPTVWTAGYGSGYTVNGDGVRPCGNVRTPPDWFAAAFPGADTSKELVGYEICDVVRDCTKRYAWQLLSMLEILIALGCPGVGQATHFFSHSQAETLSQTYEAMINYMASTRDGRRMFELPLFFLDYLCIRQCAKGDFKPKAVEVIIGAIGRVVLVLEPLRAPTTLSRAWCVYEISCTLRTNASLAVASCSEGTGIKRQMVELSKVLTIDLSACDAKEKADKVMIIDHIKSMGTMEDANQKVLGMVRDSIKNMR
jgi:hypothetical protein